MSRIIRVLCVFLLSFSSLAIAQNLGTGLYAFGSFDSRGFDTINLGNLNTHFEIPIINKQGRGMNFTYALAYDGLIWSTSTSGSTTSWQPDPSWGFHGQLLGGALTGFISITQGTKSCPLYAGKVQHGTTDTNYVYHDPYGRNHRFNYSWQDCPLPTDTTVVTGDGSTSDGSGLSLSLSDGTIHTRSGSVINVPTTIVGTNPTGSSSITDTNGNTITNNGNGTFTDTLGVTALTIGGSGTPSSPTTLTYPVTLQANGATSATASIAYKAYTVQTNFQCSGITEYGATSVNLVDHITLPDASASTYSFTYEATPGVSGAVTGRLASVTLPTGGTISYSYSGGCSSAGAGINADGTVGSLTRVTSDGTRSYTRSSVNSNATNTTLQDEKGNQALYQFTIFNSLFYETHRQIYQGTIGGTPLLDQSVCYNGATPSCDGAAISSSQITQTATLSSYNGLSQLGVNNVYDASGMLTSSTQMSGSTILESVHNSYNSLEEVLTSSTTDPSGNTVASSTYGYDETTPTATSGIPQHNAVSGTRGNQTSAHVSAGATYLSTTTTYYDTGVPIATTTPNGTTQYGYDSTQTFATTTTLPTPSSGVALATSASYDQQSGAPISATGMNPGQTTQVTQYDGLLRPTAVTLPNGGSTTHNYFWKNSLGYFQTSAVTALNSTTNADTEIEYDAYGRTSRVAVYNGQSSNGWYQVDYCYDATGLLQFQSTKYQSTGFVAAKQCSGNGPSYVYDALGRVTSSTNADGTVYYVYTGRAVKTTDVNNVQKITQYDLLGRISGVCEISSNASMPGSGSPVACGMDIAGTGFLTNYAYNLQNHTTTIAQGAQQRVFQTDAAGRTTSVTEPERGTTSYSYAYNNTGLVVTRTRPKANQITATVLTTTTTQYDSLGRVVAVTYDDGLTPNKSFFYDVACCWSNGSSATNLKGQLAVMGAMTSASDHTGAMFSYDMMGHVTTMWQCAPSTCPTSASQLSRPALTISYDLAGNLTGEADGGGVTYSYAYSPASEVLSITSNQTADSEHPPNLVSNVQNGVNGPISYALGNGLNVAATYDSLGRLNGRWVCSGSSQANCTGGTQIYGFTLSQKGSRIPGLCDTVINQCLGYGYDEFNRLTSLSGQQNFSYVYDRYGNRTQQNAPQGGPAPSYSFNTSTNQIVGLGYDAAGNLTSDGFHSYTYDAEGNVLQVDGGATATYVYDALNHRVRENVGTNATEFVYNAQGQRASIWNATTGAIIQGQVYWGSMPVSFRENGVRFQHQDYLGTERMRTNWAGSIESTFTSLPFGDNFALSGPDIDQHHFAQLDHDSESSTEHAQFRQYSSIQGRWHSPDPHDGSYDASNPQSFNRYSYVGNNPLSAIDPLGLSTIKAGDDVGLGFVGGGGSAFASTWNEFTTFVTVSSPDGGTYNYSQDAWNNIASSDAGNIVNSDGTITSAADGGVGGNVGWSMAGLVFYDVPTSQISAPSKPAAPTKKPPQSAVAGAVSLPIAPGIIWSIPFAFIPNGDACLGLGVGFGSPGINAGGVTTSASNIEDVLGGPSVAVTAQPWGIGGGQTSHNSSGLAYGNSFGTPGASLTVSYSVCF